MRETVAVPPDSRRAARSLPAFVLLAGVQFVLIAAITVLSVALPAIQREFGLSLGALTLVSAAYGLSFSGLLMLGGRLTDLLGRRRLLRIGAAAFALASLAVMLAPGYPALLAARFAQGVGAALAAPAAMALLGDLYPDPTVRSRMTAIWGTVASIGATSGTLLSGVVLAVGSWRWSMALPAAIGLLAWLAGPRLLPPGPEPVRSRIDYPGAALVTTGLTALSYGLVLAVDHGLGTPEVLIPLVAGAVLLVAFLLVEARATQPLLPPSFLVSARRSAALLAVLVAAAAMSGVFFFLSLYLQQVRGLSPLAASGVFLPFSLVLLATGAASGRLVGRWGARTVTGTGLLLAAAGLLLLSRLAPDSVTWTVAAGLLLFPAGTALTFSGATVAAVEDTPPGQMGLAAGAANTAMEVGPTVGLAVLVYVSGATSSGSTPTQGYAAAFLAAALVLAVTGGCAIRALRHRR
ncbi:MFS transporter [Micromonospora sp. SCSIO 07396]